MSSPVPSLPTDVEKIATPLLLGYMLNWALQGALSLQVYIYFLVFQKDHLVNRVLVSGVFILETVQTGLLTENSLRSFSRGFGDVEALDRDGLIWFAVPIMGGIVAFATQAFYAYRIKILARSYVVPSFILFLAFVQLGGGIAMGVVAKRVVFNSKLMTGNSLIIVGFWNGGSALCDVIIAISMTFYYTFVKLTRRARDTGLRSTQKVIGKLTGLVIETGTLTAVTALISLVLAFLPSLPTSSYYHVTNAMLGKFYSNSMMAMYNSRMKLAETNDNSSAAVTQVGWRRAPITDSGIELYPMVGTRAKLQDGSSGKSGDEKPRELMASVQKASEEEYSAIGKVVSQRV